MSQHQLLLLAFFAGIAAAVNPLIQLGTPSLDLLKYQYDTEITEGADGECSYRLEMSFEHHESFPFGTLETCQVDVRAEDGLNYFDPRWYYDRFDYATRLATGLDHISIDWNACGHPGFGFQTPHYDAHIYTVSPEFRAAQMKCDKIHGTVVCKPESEQTGTGKGYYVFGQVASTRQLDNLPAGYEWELHAAVEYMGTHGGNLSREPTSPENWTEPILYFTSFNGAICAIEPMFPYTFTIGDEDKFHEETVEYEVQTMATLPTYYSMDFDHVRARTTLVFEGTSALCKADFADAQKNPPKPMTPQSTTSAAAPRASAAIAVVPLLFLALSWFA